MIKYKRIIEVLEAKATLEGAGVHLHRGFGYPQVPKFDPFLLFDDFSGEEPQYYKPGFPWHPHRGIETVTYVLKGNVNHKDSVGNKGNIGAGDVQWMSAGSGILHEEMPKGSTGMVGFQLWVNLPKDKKMSQPNYQEIIKKDIPIFTEIKDSKIRIISGDVSNIKGPVKDIAASPIYLDVEVKRNKSFIFELPLGYNTFLYMIEGNVGLVEDEQIKYKKGQILYLGTDGTVLKLNAGSKGAKFLLASGKPLNEAIAWRGPIVMNNEAELDLAWQELHQGNFIKNV